MDKMKIIEINNNDIYFKSSLWGVETISLNNKEISRRLVVLSSKKEILIDGKKYTVRSKSPWYPSNRITVTVEDEDKKQLVSTVYILPIKELVKSLLCLFFATIGLTLTFIALVDSLFVK